MSLHKKWNRSSAWSPEVLAKLTTATNMAAQSAIQTFESTFDSGSLTAEQRTAAIQLLANGVTDGMKKFEESLRSKHVEIEVNAVQKFCC
jgi:hypothetical protein